jgi:hypothetical protein
MLPTESFDLEANQRTDLTAVESANVCSMSMSSEVDLTFVVKAFAVAVFVTLRVLTDFDFFMVFVDLVVAFVALRAVFVVVRFIPPSLTRPDAVSTPRATFPFSCCEPPRRTVRQSEHSPRPQRLKFQQFEVF